MADAYALAYFGCSVSHLKRHGIVGSVHPISSPGETWLDTAGGRMAVQAQEMVTWQWNEERRERHQRNGVAVVTADELILFHAPRMKVAQIPAANSERGSGWRDAEVAKMIDEGVAKKVRRFKRADITAIGYLADAERLRIEHGGQVEDLAGFANKVELERAGTAIAQAVLPDAPSEHRVCAVTGDLLRPMLNKVVYATLAGTAFIMAKLLIGDDAGEVSPRRQWMADLLASIPLAAIVTLAVIAVVATLAYARRRFVMGYWIERWYLDPAGS